MVPPHRHRQDHDGADPGTLISLTSESAVVAGIPVGSDGAAEIRPVDRGHAGVSGLYQRLTVTENLEYSRAYPFATGYSGVGQGRSNSPFRAPSRKHAHSCGV